MSKKTVPLIGGLVAGLLLLSTGGYVAWSFYVPGGDTCGPKSRDKFRIMVDVGHTPKEPGAISARGATEYSFNLKLAARIKQELNAVGFHSTRILAIEQPGKPGLLKRPQVANDWPADLFVSIHHDSVQPQYLKSWPFGSKERHYSDEFRGFSLFVSRNNRAFHDSARLARAIADRLIWAGLNFTRHHHDDIEGERRAWLDESRGIYQYDELAVLRLTTMPAVLLEAGVIVNRDEELELASSQRRDATARAVAAAVSDFCIATPIPHVAATQ